MVTIYTPGFLNQLLGYKRPIPLNQQTVLLRVLAQFVRAGLSPLNALSVLAQGGDKRLRELAQRCQVFLKEGLTISCALKRGGYCIDPVVLALLETGETMGTLLDALENALNCVERTQSFRQQTRATLRYPFLVLLVLLVSLYCLKAFLLPHLEFLTTESDVSKGWATISLLYILGPDISWFSYILGAIFLISGMALWARLSERPRYVWHRVLLALPITAPFILSLRWSYFFYLVSIALRTSVTLPGALHIAERVLGYLPLQTFASNARIAVFEGADFSTSFRHAPGILPEVFQLICAGERAGNLASMCGHIAQIYHERLNHYKELFEAYAGPCALGCLTMVFMWVIFGAVLPFYDHLSDMTGGTGM